MRTGGLLRRRWNFLQSRGEFVAQLWCAFHECLLSVHSLCLEKEGKEGGVSCLLRELHQPFL